MKAANIRGAAKNQEQKNEIEAGKKAVEARNDAVKAEHLEADLEKARKRKRLLERRESTEEEEPKQEVIWTYLTPI